MSQNKKTEYDYLLAPLHGRIPKAPCWFNQAVNIKSRKYKLYLNGRNISYQIWPVTKTPSWNLEDQFSSLSGKLEALKKNVWHKTPCLIFIHGGYAHKHWWDFIAPFYTECFEVVALDLSGMGDSDWCDTYSFNLHTEDIYQLINRMGILDQQDRFYGIIGHSYGGYVAFQFLQRVLELKKSPPLTIIVDTPLMNLFHLEYHEKQSNSSRRLKTYKTLKEALARFRLAPNQHCDNLFLLDYIARKSVRQTQNANQADWRWKFDPNLFNRYHRKQVSTEAVSFDQKAKLAFLRGDNSILLAQKEWQELQNFFLNTLRIPFKNLIFDEIKSAQHHVFLDQPLLFVEKIAEILTMFKE